MEATIVYWGYIGFEKDLGSSSQTLRVREGVGLWGLGSTSATTWVPAPLRNSLL